MFILMINPETLHLIGESHQLKKWVWIRPKMSHLRQMSQV